MTDERYSFIKENDPTGIKWRSTSEVIMLLMQLTADSRGQRLEDEIGHLAGVATLFKLARDMGIIPVDDFDRFESAHRIAMNDFTDITMKLATRALKTEGNA